MKKLNLLLLFLTLVLVLVSCNKDEANKIKHTVVVDSAVAPTCTEDGLTEGKHCSVCNEIITPQTVAEKLGHTVVVDSAVVPTCTEDGLTEGKHCSVCNEIIIPQSVINKLGHTVVIDSAVTPTCTKDGLTEGKHCSVCNEIITPRSVINKLSHTVVIDSAVAPTCTKDGLTEGKHCSVCNEIIAPQTVVDKLGHTVVVDSAVVPTCTEDGLTEGKHCSVCKEIITPQSVINKLGHTVVIDSAVTPTCTEDGLTEGKHCSVCKEILALQTTLNKLNHIEIASTCTKWGATYKNTCALCKTKLKKQEFIKPTGHNYVDGKCSLCNKIKIDYSDISLYKSNEGYTYFNTVKNGDDMRDLYDEMERVLTNFHTSPEYASFYKNNEELGDLYTVANFDYSKYNLTLDEAKTVYTVFRKDHPVFYWMSYWLYWNDKTITITTVTKYAKGTARMEYNEMLYDGIEEYAALADGESSEYTIALIYYDAIIKNNSYAYNEKGDPEPAQWAHSVIGDFAHSQMVCEGYTKLFELLLNMHGIKNRHVSGIANGDHSWNLVRMDNNLWYNFDLTWGDTTDNTYKYFCALDSDFTTHTPKPANQLGMYFNYTLPPRATVRFTSDETLELGEVFTTGNSKYALSSSTTVKHISGARPSNGKILYNGKVYSLEN